MFFFSSLHNVIIIFSSALVTCNFGVLNVGDVTGADCIANPVVVIVVVDLGYRSRGTIDLAEIPNAHSHVRLNWSGDLLIAKPKGYIIKMCVIMKRGFYFFFAVCFST